MTDNTTAVAAVNKGTVRSPQLMQLVREIRLEEAMGDFTVEAFHLSGKIIIRQGADGASRAVPYLGQLGPNPISHDAFTPAVWPRWRLTGTLGAVAAHYRQRGVDCSDPAGWIPRQDPGGRETYWHLQPRHATQVFSRLLDAQLRCPQDTAATVVVPMLGMRAWSKYIKYFRRRVFKQWVEGLGEVAHLVLRFEAGDGLLPRSAPREWQGPDRGEQERGVGGVKDGKGVGLEGQKYCR